MLADHRHNAILEELRRHGSIRVSDVADRLGVSAVTVRRDIEQLAAQGLVTRVHGGATLPEAAGAEGLAPDLVLGLVVPSAGYYFPEIIQGARTAAAALGARLTLGISGYAAGQDREQAERLAAAGAAGLLVTSNEAPGDSPATLEWLAALRVPAVLVERESARGCVPLEHVRSDHAQGAYRAVRHLAGLGRERLGLVLRTTPTEPWLRAGHDAALADLGLAAGPAFTLPTQAPDVAAPTTEDQVERIVAAVRRGELDGALVHTDQDAILLVQRLRAAGLDVPGDLAIVAYDDEVAGLADVPLTAVAPPKRAVGAAAVETLVRRLRDPRRPPHRLSLVPELRVRSSCGAAER
ncbi:substrate-binding domain-containing protein [Actinomadura kijaniata]|uniref:DNA-binding LacI/PurR family transcriptional regulator n=1 Tax=Actinomadura namibiensis TaxID=182080 RepID=A0A7W3LWY0_ACTNM|nr:substrate-binding domain-containing protein [Actinomadura namibiensis]MBA8955791.1 DNA-binding LacI/PurR family transcriptional regulator [Actinomadura namibiensis]